MVKLFVAGLGNEVDVMGLVELFSIHGTVEVVNIVSDRATGKGKGYAFLEMTDLAGAERAIDALNGITFKGRKLDVKKADQGVKSSPARKMPFKKDGQAPRPYKPKA
ncbi:RNA recognition motif domain-containing protein [Pedobacter sp. AW1-32]|uniref:RNA recognition motif domain-containing protein n=1 Tax=Pedobacter sp. AW1-32 TaxID=3383026 RepID=UPI003FEFAAB9